jgi:hypothetical protein
MKTFLIPIFFIALTPAFAQYNSPSSDPNYISNGKGRDAAYLKCERAMRSVKKGEKSDDLPACRAYNTLNHDFMAKSENVLELTQLGCRGEKSSDDLYHKTPDAAIVARLEACKQRSAVYTFSKKMYCTKNGEPRKGVCPNLKK